MIPSSYSVRASSDKNLKEKNFDDFMPYEVLKGGCVGR
jgi:hypothetical protein